jgi:hypothetical protein
MNIVKINTTSFTIQGLTALEIGIITSLLGKIDSHYDLYAAFYDAVKGQVPMVKIYNNANPDNAEVVSLKAKVTDHIRPAWL